MSKTLSSKIHKNIILEIRPRLQSVNVLIALTPSTTTRIIKVILSLNSFDLIIDEEISTISCGSLCVVLNSLTSLIITDTSVSFRFATRVNFDDWGSFKTELLQISKNKSNAISGNIPIEKHIEYDVLCGNCKQNLCGKTLAFERVLPLPSEGSEPSDWFCHSHCHNGNGAASFTSLDLNPKISDIFYTHCYFHVSSDSVVNIRNSDNIVVCRRCLTWLGLVQNQKTIKLWFNTVTFKNIDNYHYSTTPLSDTFISIKSILSNNLFNSIKLLLTCRSSRDKNDYILIWVLEKQLNIHIHDGGLNMKDCKVAKVLFKYENDCSDIVKTWEDDTSVTCLTVSKPMIVEVLKDLYKYNTIFPKQYSQSNNFYISYLTMYE